MKILDDISKEIIVEYKAGNAQRRVLLQTLKASLLSKQKDLADKFDDNEATKTLKHELKQRSEALLQYKEAKRQDLVEKMQFEIDEIKKFLPEEMPVEEIENIVKSIVEKSTDKSFGPLMGQIMAQIGDRADGKTVSAILQKYL